MRSGVASNEPMRMMWLSAGGDVTRLSWPFACCLVQGNDQALVRQYTRGRRPAMQSRAWYAEAREKTRRERKKPDQRAWVCSSLGRGLGSSLVGNGLI